MNANQQQAISLIEQQQKGIEYTTTWMAGEQLKDICRQEPENAELIAQDLAMPEMSLAAAEKKIKAWADSHKKGNQACVPINVAEDILRKFYGLQKPAHRQGETVISLAPPTPTPRQGLALDLADFL